MKIDLPTELVLQLLEFSPAFREHAVGMIRLASCIEPSDSLRSRVTNIVRENIGNKIAAIKAVRQFIQDNACAFIVVASFPEIDMKPIKPDWLGLADSKRLVEFIF